MPRFSLLLALLAATTPVHAGGLVLPENTRLEIMTWTPQMEQYRVIHTCTLTGTAIKCTGTIKLPANYVETRDDMNGTLVDGALKSTSRSTTRYSDPNCTATYITHGGMTLTLEEGGGGHGQWNGGTGTYVAAGAKCRPLLGKTDTHPAQQISVSWRLLEGSIEPPGFGDRQIKSALWRQLGQAEGPLAHTCFDETFAKLKEPRNAEMMERIETAAYQQHMVEVAAEMANADDFDPRWLESAKGIGGDGSAMQRFADKMVKLLPGPFGTLISLSQKAYRVSVGVSDQVVLPKLKGKLYEAFAAERAARPNDPPSEVLKEASTHVGGWADLKTGLIHHFPGANDTARENAMASYLAARFDFLSKVREIAANKERHLASAWKDAANDVARIRMTMLDCMAK